MEPITLLTISTQEGGTVNIFPLNGRYSFDTAEDIQKTSEYIFSERKDILDKLIEHFGENSFECESATSYVIVPTLQAVINLLSNPYLDYDHSLVQLHELTLFEVQ